MSSTWHTVFAGETNNPNFCGTCGALQTLPETGNTIVCWACSQSAPIQALASKPVVTITTKNIDEEANETKITEKSNTGSKIREECPQCGNEEMNFHTAQLRSADEGQTIFYECPKCGFKQTVNS